MGRLHSFKLHVYLSDKDKAAKGFIFYGEGLSLEGGEGVGELIDALVKKGLENFYLKALGRVLQQGEDVLGNLGWRLLELMLLLLTLRVTVGVSIGKSLVASGRTSCPDALMSRGLLYAMSG